MNCKALLTCDKVIIDRQGTHSLINVILNVSIKLQEAQAGQTPKEIQIPKSATAPTQWWVYTLWEPSQADVGRSFRQIYEVYWPSGDKLETPKLELPFVQQDDKQQQTTYSIVGFPVGQEGDVTILTWLESSEGKQITDKLTSHVRIEHLTGKVNPPAMPSHISPFAKPQ